MPMNVLKIFLSVICFGETLLICLLTFIGATYFLFGGKESTGSLVVIISISAFILSVVIAGFAAVKLSLMTKYWSNRTIVFVFFLATLLLIATVLSLQVFNYVAI
jgi:hypothetical protein